MVQQSDETIKLEMTIDRAELERQLGTVFQGPGAAGAKAGGKAPARVKPTTVSADGKMAKQFSHMKKLVGIYFGINAMVKNSQVMSTTLGALGQTMGALMDSFLAPLIPHLIPLLTKIASWIPAAAQAGEDVSDAIDDMGKDFADFSKQSGMEKTKRVAQTVGASLLDLGKIATGIGKTTGQKNIEELESLGAKPTGVQRWLGGTDALRKETYGKAFGAETGIGRLPTGTQNALSRMNDQQLQDFLGRQTESGIQITIQGNTNEEILAAVRVELETHRRDMDSGSSLGNN